MHLFPESGFDQSAATPVFLGVLVSWLFTETFGWVFAGLVVPGYLASLFLLDPRAAAMDVGEAALTYAVARLLGEHLSRTGLTSRVFGRERFLLVLVVSVLVRLGVEGVAFARLLPHTAWTHSVGLVVVPLAANACWKTGLFRGAVQNGVPTAIVYLLLRYVLVPHTNLSLGGFQLANENIAARFLASPKAYLLLLTGAVLAAIANVRYGWDYNGILLPALLAFVVTNPVKLVATLAEVLLLVALARGLSAATPLGRWNIEGPRRPALFFTLDYALRFAFAAAIGRSLPGTDVVELTGFGYLLPTLLAVKVSQKGFASLVLLPTLTVSVSALGLASLLGFAAHELDPPREEETEAVTRILGRAPESPVGAALWLSALARPSARRRTDDASLRAETMAKLSLELATGSRPVIPPYLGVQTIGASDIVVLRERFQNPDHRLGLPAILLSRRPPSGGRVVLLVTAPLAGPETAAMAGRLLETGAAEFVVVAGVEESSPHPGSSARGLARAIADGTPGAVRRAGLVIGLRPGGDDAPTARLGERASREPRLASLLDAVAPDIHRDRAPRDPGDDVTMRLPASLMAALVPSTALTTSLATSTAVAMSLDDARSSSDAPSVEDLLALRRLVLSPLLGGSGEPLSVPLARASATALGYELLGPSRFPGGDDALVLRGNSHGKPLAVVARVRPTTGVVLELPRGLHSVARTAALRLMDPLHADAVIVGLAAEGSALENPAFAEAHASATWPQAERSSVVITVREAALPGSGTLAAVGSWGGTSGVEWEGRVTEALGSLGVPAGHVSLDFWTRERAARSVFGGVPLVSLTLDPALRRGGAFARSPEREEPEWSLPFEDTTCTSAAARLAATLPTARVDAPETVLSLARASVIEHSVAARRALERLSATTATARARVRAGTGVFLVVVGRTPRGLEAGSFPLEMSTMKTNAPTSTAAFVEECALVLEQGGMCRVPRRP